MADPFPYIGDYFLSTMLALEVSHFCGTTCNPFHTESTLVQSLAMYPVMRSQAKVANLPRTNEYFYTQDIVPRPTMTVSPNTLLPCLACDPTSLGNLEPLCALLLAKGFTWDTLGLDIVTARGGSTKMNTYTYRRFPSRKRKLSGRTTSDWYY